MSKRGRNGIWPGPTGREDITAAEVLLRSKVSKLCIKLLSLGGTSTREISQQTPITPGFENQWDLHPEVCRKLKLKRHMQKLSCPSPRDSSLKRTWVICEGESLTDFRVCAAEPGTFIIFSGSVATEEHQDLCSPTPTWSRAGGRQFDSPHLIPGSPVDPSKLALLQNYTTTPSKWLWPALEPLQSSSTLGDGPANHTAFNGHNSPLEPALSGSSPAHQ